MLTNTTERNIKFDLEEQGKETSKLVTSDANSGSAGRLKASAPLQEGFASAGATSSRSLPQIFL